MTIAYTISLAALLSADAAILLWFAVGILIPAMREIWATNG